MEASGEGVDTAIEALGDEMERALPVAERELDDGVKVLVRFLKGGTGA